MPIKSGRIVLWPIVTVLVAGLLASCSIRRKQYVNPISKDTQQPDKVLFDKAIHDIEHGRYDVARITLQTMISTYDTSEYLAKAKLAVADSWFREGGSNGLAQAKAEYKDFILFYPTLEEAAEAQEKVCRIEYDQMDKPDREMTHALQADEECRQVLVQFPNSKFAPQAQEYSRQVQEVLAEAEYRVGLFYHTRGSFIAAANRLQGLTNHYPLYSKADEALWREGDSYSRLGPRNRDKAADAYARIVRDYPLSSYVEGAKKKLTAMEQPIPEPDPVAMNRMKYELANQSKPGPMSHFLGIFQRSPDVSMAAKSGMPVMTAFRPTTPVSVPPPSSGEAGIGSDVTVSPVSDSSAVDTKPDARQTLPAAGSSAGQAEPVPSSAQPVAKKKQNSKKQQQKNSQPQ
jgi:outer membrane protein assembly factor BamD